MSLKVFSLSSSYCMHCISVRTYMYFAEQDPHILIVIRDYWPALIFWLFFQRGAEVRSGHRGGKSVMFKMKQLTLSHFINQLIVHYGSHKQTCILPALIHETLNISVRTGGILFISYGHVAPQLICWKIYGSDLLHENHGLGQECELVPSQECWVEPTQVYRISSLLSIHLPLILFSFFLYSPLIFLFVVKFFLANNSSSFSFLSSS